MLRLLQSAYSTFFAPRQKNEDIRNREVVLNVLLAGTLGIIGLAILYLAANYVHGDTFLASRIMMLWLAFLLVVGIYWLSRSGRYRLAAWLLVGIYLALSFCVGFVWSVTLPAAVLLYGLVVVLAGILLGPRYSLAGFGVVIACLVGTATADRMGLITHDLSWKQKSTSADDIVALTFMLGIIASVSWLFNYQTARSLARARRAEAALRKQKALLEIKVEERTRELQEVQLEKVKQMYRFAELGQLSTALMHELANHLTSLTLDIEGLQGKGRSRAVSRARRSINYINEMVVRVREQLHGKSRIRTFNAVDEIDAVVKMLRHKAQLASVSLEWQPPADSKPFRINGEPIWLRQMIANLISNGIDAHYEPRDDIEERRAVEVQVASDEHHVFITVNDWGRGLPKEYCNRLFEPFFSTKETGMGMGLYVAKQVAEDQFLGNIKIANPARPTSFVVTLPRA